MPNGVLTLMDIAKLNESDMLMPLIDEASRLTPEISGVDGRGTRVPGLGAGKTIKGINYEITVRNALPTVAFRSANEGTDPTKSGYVNRLVECFSMTPKWAIDVILADRSEEGLPVLMAREAAAHVKAALMHCCAQFYEGTSNDAKGFIGLKGQYDPALTLDATGTGAATSSVWAVKFGPENVQWVYGNNGKFRVPDMRVGDMEDGNNKKYTAFIQEMIAHIGLQVASKYSVARIKNIHATDANKTLDDDMLAQLMTLPPSGYTFDALFMNKRSLESLRRSRTATNTTGSPAPTPTEYEGIPIIASDNVSILEAAS